MLTPSSLCLRDHRSRTGARPGLIDVENINKCRYIDEWWKKAPNHYSHNICGLTISMLFCEWFISSLNRDNLFLIDCWVVRRRSTKPRQNDPNKVLGRRSQPQQSAPLQCCRLLGTSKYIQTRIFHVHFSSSIHHLWNSILWYYAHIAHSSGLSEVWVS